MALYVDLPTFRSLTVIPGADVDLIEANNPGFIEARSAIHQEEIEARLAKRYAVPFGVPIPGIIKIWIVAMLTADAYSRRGFNPTLAELQPMLDAAERAIAQVKEAADSDTGLFVLPFREGGLDGVLFGGPLGYSETSPYVSLDLERQIGRGEDSRGRGS